MQIYTSEADKIDAFESWLSNNGKNAPSTFDRREMLR
jgi:hypothetical protein